MARTAVAIRHVAFEDLGLIGPVLADRGYDVGYVDAWDADGLDPLAADLWVVLGGPVGVYETDVYPFLTDELRLIEARLAADRPTLGICLGAQLMARALGARVYPSGTKEIGWAPVRLTEAGAASALAPLGEGDALVLHWHGDTYDLPEGALHLARSDLVEQQAFSLGPRRLGLQFHVEATAAMLEAWYVGHTVEIAHSGGVSVPQLRSGTSHHAEACNARGRRFLARWLDGAEAG